MNYHWMWILLITFAQTNNKQTHHGLWPIERK